MLTDEQIDAVWDEWHGRRGFQATPKEARREFARAVLAAAQPDVVEALRKALDTMWEVRRTGSYVGIGDAIDAARTALGEKHE